MQCALKVYIFVCGLWGHHWAHNYLWNVTDSGQCVLGSSITLLSVHPVNETTLDELTEASHLNGHDLPGDIPDGDEYFPGYVLLPWWGVLRNLSKTLIIIANEHATSLANETTTSLVNLQTSLDSLAKVILDRKTTLGYILAEQRGVCVTTNASGCSYINIQL